MSPGGASSTANDNESLEDKSIRGSPAAWSQGQVCQELRQPVIVFTSSLSLSVGYFGKKSGTAGVSRRVIENPNTVKFPRHHCRCSERKRGHHGAFDSGRGEIGVRAIRIALSPLFASTDCPPPFSF